MKLKPIAVWLLSPLLGLALASAAAAEVINFDNDSLTHGATVSTVTSDGGFGPIAIFGENGKDIGGANWARAFDSNTPTCGDQDLGTPNETCDPPGPGIGADGELGQPNENCVALNNVLIIQELSCGSGTCTPVCSPNDGSDPFADDSDNANGMNIATSGLASKACRPSSWDGSRPASTSYASRR
jgi:hypothetical protein